VVHQELQEQVVLQVHLALAVPQELQELAVLQVQVVQVELDLIQLLTQEIIEY
jgi:hypothetical protein